MIYSEIKHNIFEAHEPKFQLSACTTRLEWERCGVKRFKSEKDVYIDYSLCNLVGGERHLIIYQMDFKWFYKLE